MKIDLHTHSSASDGTQPPREVIRSAAPVLITDVANDPRPHRRTMEHWGVRAMLGVPLVALGAFEALALPIILAKRWKSPPE